MAWRWALVKNRCARPDASAVREVVEAITVGAEPGIR
jgi:hypothetical protein